MYYSIMGKQVGVSIRDDELSHSDELREFMLVLRRALLIIVRWIEKRYSLQS